MTPSIPTAADIAAVVFERVLPDDIAAPYPLQELEANEGICAQESDLD